jgi:hypothetical protein
VLCSRPRFIQGMGVVLEREWVLCSSGNGCCARAGMGICARAGMDVVAYERMVP